MLIIHFADKLMQEEKKFIEEKECFKCGSKKNLKEDPNIEGLFFVLTAGKKERGEINEKWG
jgi:hypothetical protein